ncbi:hypothetical protein PR202_ga22734 [Eleusine coracana subsp. coracana]|uniref:DYW domain-containing protein n=1 Tax=Eleusine coracana subsp. coracana TaxID=191504 RepID=A0AAV5D2H4_ELECO|nr:hypothetical protein PR202_ga22734 [Eleusine coracana subsp. coracana]
MLRCSSMPSITLYWCSRPLAPASSSCFVGRRRRKIFKLAKYCARTRPPRRLAVGRLSTAAAEPCPHHDLLPHAPPPALPSTSSAHPLASHPHPAVAAFPHAGFSHLADHPLLARAVHGFVLRRALPLSAFHRNTLLAFYFRRQPGHGGASAAAALHLFDEMPHRTDSSWYTAISGCVRCGLDSTAFDLLGDMRACGVPLSGFALASLVTVCERRREWMEGTAIHALTHRAGLMGNVYIGTALLHMYGSRGLVQDARKLFWEMPERNVVSWTALMVALSSNGYCDEALEAYRRMRREGVTCNANAFATVVSLCGALEDEAAGLQVAAHVVVSGIQSHVSVANSLITMLGNLGKVQDAERLFDRMKERNTISWNAMVSMYSHQGACSKCFLILSDMRHIGARPDVTTLCSLASVCASSDYVAYGSGVHSLCIRTGHHSPLPVINALVNMYSSAGKLDDAEFLFWNMSTRDVISWNTMISAYVQNDNCIDAMKTVGQLLQTDEAAPNHMTFSSALGACSSLMDGRMVHAMIYQRNLHNNLLVGSSSDVFERIINKSAIAWNAMIAANVQHGHGEEALKLLMDMRHAGNKLDHVCLTECLSSQCKLGITRRRPTQCWNTLISGYAKYGYFKEAEDTFKQMVSVGQKPDYVTFVALLSACSHAGLVDKGIKYYDSMASAFGVSPGIKHCVCIVDLLGRLGRFSEAEKFIEEMPVLPNDLIWRSLLSSSRTHKNLDIGRKAAKKLLELDPFDDSAYVLLSNLYATNARWVDVDKLRSHMKTIKLNKRPACSWLKLKNELREVGYIADTSSALHDTDEEQKEQNLWNHSEKLALAYGLIVVPEGSTIRIFKNLRAEAVVAERPPAPGPAPHDAYRPAPARRSAQQNPEAPVAHEVAMGLRVAQAKAPVPCVAQAKAPRPCVAR